MIGSIRSGYRQLLFENRHLRRRERVFTDRTNYFDMYDDQQIHNIIPHYDLVSEESLVFSDYCCEIVGPKYVSFRCYDQKGPTFHKSLVTTSKIHTVCYGTAFYAVLLYVCLFSNHISSKVITLEMCFLFANTFGKTMFMFPIVF